jgi:hypothetical protein
MPPKKTKNVGIDFEPEDRRRKFEVENFLF